MTRPAITQCAGISDKAICSQFGFRIGRIIDMSEFSDGTGMQSRYDNFLLAMASIAVYTS